MTLDLGGVLADAWRQWRRDREVLLGVAGLFLFLPQFAMLLLLPESPAPPAGAADEASIRAWLDQVFAWYSANGPLMASSDLVALFGALAILVLYLDPARPDLAGALRRAVVLLPRYLLASILVLVPIALGLLLILPGVYLQGRMLLVGPALVAEQPLGAARAIGRSAALTRGRGLVLAALAFAMLFGGRMLSAPFLALGEALDGAPMRNPVVAALIDAGAAAALTAVALATVLVRVALYRRLVASRGA